MKNLILTLLALTAILLPARAGTVVDMASYGVRPGTGKDMAARVAAALVKIEKKYGKTDITLRFAPGSYNFYPEKAVSREYYISNHDQPNPKAVGLDFDGWTNLTIDAQDADFIFHGRMLPLALVNSTGCTLRGFSIDFDNPHIAQVEVVKSDAEGITFRPEAWVKSRVDEKGRFITYGRGWELTPQNGIAFHPLTHHIIYNTSDLWCPVDSVIPNSDGTIFAPRWRDSRLAPGTKVVLRSWQRPAPGIFVSLSVDTRIENVRVHYAEGMGLLAQMSTDITLDGFGVCRRGDDDPRLFTTQADATHFSGCKGLVDSRNGLYEGMMDDAINIHGTYLKVVGREGDRTLVGRYMHPQTYGFFWGQEGDSVSFIASRAMQIVGRANVIASITPADSPRLDGAKEFRITFRDPVPAEIDPQGAYGIENLTWSPAANFTGNIVRNNRARGSLFSTPRPVLVADNIFDHTSGCAILLCGDCNGWYETGACRDVLITRNRFINALTSRFQFTEAVISVYPEIPELERQTEYFHGGPSTPGIVIEGNHFETFDRPLLFAKSVDGLRFTGNDVTTTTDFRPYHPNRFTFLFRKTRNVTVQSNRFDRPEEVSIFIE